MDTDLKTGIVVLLAALTLAGCSATPGTKHDPYNSPDSQRSRAGQTQDEMSKDTSK